MFVNFKERLHMVQQDFSTGFKTLGDKSRESKIRRRSRNTSMTEDQVIGLQEFLLLLLVMAMDCHLSFQQMLADDGRFEESLPPVFIAGLEILSRYEESWFPLHKRTKDCAQAAEVVDGDIVMLSAHWERRRTALTQLQQQLQSLPSFINELDAITANIAHLEGDFEEMESRLVYLETLCCQCDEQTFKQQNVNNLETYRKKKRKELEVLDADLSSQHTQKVAEVEQAMQQKLRERQKVYEAAFNQDMKEYLSTGHVEHREPTEFDVHVLDQITVANISDQEALDDFLNSTDDETTESSLQSGLDLESCSPNSTTSQSNQIPATHNQVYNQDAEWEQVEEEASDESDKPVVQVDEEGIQTDTSLVCCMTDISDPTDLLSCRQPGP